MADTRTARHDPAAVREEKAAARDEKLVALHQRLAEQVQQLRTGEDWQRWLTVASKFHSYSFANTIAILATRPDATLVCGYRKWQELGRQVDKGEKGIPILAPVLRRPRRADGHDGAPEPAAIAATNAEPTVDADPEPSVPLGRRRLVGFRLAYVWDVAQTSGEPLPEQPRPQLLAGNAPDGLWDSLVGLVTDHGFTVSRGPCGGANGVTDFLARTVTIRDDVDEAQAAKTLLHESAHALLHNPAGDVPDGAFHCRGLAEVEAESVAWLVASSHGLSADGYTFPYIASWARDVPERTPEQVVAQTGQRVLTAASTILAKTQGLVAAGAEQTAELAKTAKHAEQHTAAVLQRAETMRDHTLGPRHSLQAATVVEVPRGTLLAVHADAADYFRHQLYGSWVPGYLTQRGLGGALDASSPWRIGHAPPGWTTLTDHLRGLGYSDPTLEQSGLATRARTGRLIDRFRDWLIVPVRDLDGRVVGFVGRAHPTARPDVPKYLNSSDTVLYRKHLRVLGWSETRPLWQAGTVPVLVEGPLDAIAVTLAGQGRYAGLAPCGTALSSEQAAALAVAAAKSGRLVVAYDGDPAGRQATDRAFEPLRVAAHALTVQAAALPENADPADLHRNHPEHLVRLLDGAASLVDVVVDHRLDQHAGRLHWAEGKIAAARFGAELVATLPPDQALNQARRVAGRTGLPLKAVTDLLVDQVTRDEPSAPQTARPGRRARAGAQPASPTPLGRPQVSERSASLTRRR
jgi:DNA primase catalytic core